MTLNGILLSVDYHVNNNVQVVSFQRELLRWSRFCNGLSASRPDDFLSSVAARDADGSPNIRELLLIGATSPIGSCEAERSFSLLRRIKGYLRCTATGQDRLAGLTMMVAHYHVAQQLDSQKVVKAYIQAHLRRLLCQSILFAD